MQIVKKEWPHNWPTFISDIVGASKTSEPLCTNNMAVLKLLRSDFDDGALPISFLMPPTYSPLSPVKRSLTFLLAR